MPSEQITPSASQWIDIGVNLSNKQFKDHQRDVLNAAQNVGVNNVIITGTSLSESIKAVEMAEQFGQYATAGIHPHDAKEFTPETLSYIKELALNPRVLAVGETGLDFNRNFSTPDDQINSFNKHIELASDIGKPLFLHERDAGETMIEMLTENRNRIPNAVIHCFTGSKDDLIRYLDLDLYIGITGWISDERRGLHLHELIKLIPSNRLMIETDAPYLLPRSLKPKPKNRRNEPQYLPHIGEYIANILNKSTEQFAKETFENTQRFFNIS